MKRLRSWMLVVGCLFVRAPVMAQDSSVHAFATIRVLARSDSAVVTLRWAPSSAGAWALANRYGYRIYRKKLGNDSPLRLLTPQPIWPWDSSTWEARLDTTNAFLLVALQALYGGWNVPTGQGVGGLRAQSDALNNRYALALYAADMDTMAAEALGLRWVDRSVETGAEYLYSVTAAIPDSLYKVAAGDVMVSVMSAAPLMPPLGLTANPGDRKITLQWMNSPTFSAYWIERSDDRGRTYHRLTRMPYLRLNDDSTANGFITFVDTAVRNYFRYYYRVQGITPFAETSPPAEADAMPQDFTPPPAPRILEGVEIGDRRVRIRWALPDVDDLAGFLILRSSRPDKGFVPIQFPPMPAKTWTFVDTQARYAEPYYVVAAFDTNGNVSRSLPFRVEMVDTVPPKVPVGLSGTIDTAGIVHIWWHPNDETDLLGYRVLWANDSSHPFIQRTNRPISDTFFVDTVAVDVLTPFVYYRLSAVDVRFNHSPMSEVLVLRRPDRRPPAPPAWKKIQPTDSAVLLYWVPSPSEDVIFQVIERTRGDTSVWEQLITLPPRQGFYADHSADVGVVYHYRVVAEDSAGHRSSTRQTLAGRRYAPYTLPSPAFLRAQYQEAFGVVRLEWTYPYPIRPDDEFVIYRGVHDDLLRPYKVIPAGRFSFEDVALQGGVIYRYSVAIRRGPLQVSPMSKVVMVEVR